MDDRACLPYPAARDHIFHQNSPVCIAYENQVPSASPRRTVAASLKTNSGGQQHRKASSAKVKFCDTANFPLTNGLLLCIILAPDFECSSGRLSWRIRWTWPLEGDFVLEHVLVRIQDLDLHIVSRTVHRLIEKKRHTCPH